MTRLGALPADQQYADLARAGSWPARHGARALGTGATKGRSPWFRRLASPQMSREPGASEPKDIGRVMPIAMQRVAGRADGRRVNAAVKTALAR